ncbi:uncharacterized protein UHO2_00977 [Ustilago hordei]|uniref:uncharacterized protein n=1 Tax=Ustilago hordei TaxID=120017 RepID=UPI001A3A240B|nr:uncharacterized protein UHO2_00977 [Ustilago hordei]SYW74112.1 uncharacterized protein UHO2_00977 [Ustilago hordei]
MAHADLAGICPRAIPSTDLSELYCKFHDLPNSLIPALPSYDLPDLPAFCASRPMTLDTRVDDINHLTHTRPWCLAIHSSLLIVPSYLWMECPQRLVETCSNNHIITPMDKKSHRDFSTTYLNRNCNTQDVTTYLDRIHNRHVLVTDIRF